MNNAEIQIQFPRPGEWQEFTLTPIYQDAGGYRPPARYTADDIPAEQAPAMQAVVAALVGLGEDWQAVQVWARLKEFYAPEEDAPLRTEEAVELTVEAVHAETKGRRIFTVSDYPAFSSISLLNNMSTNKEKVSWLTGLLTGWGIKESWAKVIAGAVIGALVAAGILTQPGCGHSVDVTPSRAEVCKDGSCLVIEQGHISYSQAQPVTDVPPVVQIVPSKK